LRATPGQLWAAIGGDERGFARIQSALGKPNPLLGQLVLSYQAGSGPPFNAVMYPWQYSVAGANLDFLPQQCDAWVDDETGFVNSPLVIFAAEVQQNTSINPSILTFLIQPPPQ
jgi:hypothetical protein